LGEDCEVFLPDTGDEENDINDIDFGSFDRI
jgi:hypothetical protein